MTIAENDIFNVIGQGGKANHALYSNLSFIYISIVLETTSQSGSNIPLKLLIIVRIALQYPQ